MFPGIERGIIQQLVYDEGLSIESAVEILLNRKIRVKSDISVILNELSAQKMLSTNQSVQLTMNRACIVSKSKQYYKACLHQPSKLRRPIAIQFSGEEGIDAGALQKEFFSAVLLNVKTELFEGREARLVPKNHWGSEVDFEMAGAAVGQSILLGGPSFPYLHPAIYAHLAVRTLEPGEVVDLPCAEDVPLNAATADLKDLIEKVQYRYVCRIPSYSYIYSGTPINADTIGTRSKCSD